MMAILVMVCIKAGKILKIYLQSLFSVSLYLILVSRTVGTTIILDHSIFTIYFVLSWLIAYPFIARQSPTWLKHLGKDQVNTAMQFHSSDLANYDRGSNWRVAHTRVSYLPIKTTMPSTGWGAWLIRQIYCFILITFAPVLLIKQRL